MDKTAGKSKQIRLINCVKSFGMQRIAKLFCVQKKVAALFERFSKNDGCIKR